MNCLKMCFNFFKNLILFFKKCINNKKQKKQHIFYHCSNAPYNLISYELLIKIRNVIEITKEPTQKHYFRFLEKYISILDHICDENGLLLLENYYKSLDKAIYLETNSNYSKLISFIVKSLKIGLKIINDKDSEKKLEKQILLLQDEIFKFCLENKSVDFIKTFCKLLYRLPRLTLIRRGLCLDSISITSLQID